MITASRLRTVLGHPDPEWILISLWVSVLGVQLPVDIPNFRFSPADIVLAVLIVVLLLRRPRDVFAALVPRTPVQFAIAALMVALAWGSAVSLARTGVLVQEARLNKDVGVLVLGSIVVASRVLVRDSADVRHLLRTFLVAGTFFTWLAAFFNLLLPLVMNAQFTERFNGFLLNPSANAVFLSVLLMVQIGLVIGQSRMRWGVLNTFGLTLLLVLTLSRSTWLAVMLALVLVVLLVTRGRRWLPATVALVLLIFSAQPLISVLTPVATQLVSGHVGQFEREIAPCVTPPPDIGQLFGSARPSTPRPTCVTAAGPTNGPGVTPPTVTPSTVTPSTASANAGDRYVQDAQSAANDRFGATDRLAFNVVALKLWLGSKTTAITGLGLGVFLQVSPQLFGTAVIIHNTYLWLPVEMGLPGILALFAVLYAALWTCWYLVRDRTDIALMVGIVGPLLVFLIWIVANEGLYQRTLWLLLAVGAIVVRTRVSVREHLED